MAIRGVSEELETIVMSTLIKNPYVLSKCADEIKTSYFTSEAYKKIFKILRNFYSEHLCCPSRLVLKKEIRNIESEYEEICKTVDMLFEESKELPDEDYCTEQVFNFVTRARSEGVLSSVVDSIRSSGEIDSDKIMTQLQDVYNFSMNNLSVLNLSDIDKFETIKKEAVGDELYPKVIKFFIASVNDTFQYGGLIPGTLNAVAAPPGRGKTSLLINQGASAAKQGYNTLHIFLGDMSRYDGLLRYLSTLTGKETADFVKMSIDELKEYVKRINQTGILDKITVLSYPADTISANGLMEDIRNLQRENNIHYDQIIVDYDENLKVENADSMYQNSGILYNKLAAFAVTNKTVVWIASQPKVDAWKNSEILPLESLSESSKKQKIIDFLITLGKDNKVSEAGTLFIAKNRRGTDGKIYRLQINGNNCQMIHISEDDYTNIKKRESSGTNPDSNKSFSQRIDNSNSSNVPWN